MAQENWYLFGGILFYGLSLIFFFKWGAVELAIKPEEEDSASNTKTQFGVFSLLCLALGIILFCVWHVIAGQIRLWAVFLFIFLGALLCLFLYAFGEHVRKLSG